MSSHNSLNVAKKRNFGERAMLSFAKSDNMVEPSIPQLSKAWSKIRPQL